MRASVRCQFDPKQLAPDLLLNFHRGDTQDMKTLFTTALIAMVSFKGIANAQEALVQKNLELKTSQFDTVLKKTESNIRVFVENFDLKLGGAKITSPKEVSGTLLQPVLKVSVKKCVLIVCETIDFDSEFTLQRTSGACDANYTLTGDLRRSSPQLANNYNAMNTDICIRKTATGAISTITVSLYKADTFKSGTLQKEIAKFVKAQADGIIQSFSRVMILNGVQEVVPL